MNAKQIVLGVILIAFSALTVYAIVQNGVIGLFTLPFANAATTLITVDLTISLTLIAIWIWQDAHTRGVSPLPYVILIVFFGSVGTLLYLIRRNGSETKRVVTSEARA